MNKKERRIAMATALQSATPDITVVDTLDGQFETPKTKEFTNFLTRMGVKPAEDKVLLVMEGQRRNAHLSSRNIDKLKVNKASSLRIVDVLGADKIVVERSALKTLQSLYGPVAEGGEAPVAAAQEAA
jgi:large subunit ribosomal protein L4